MGQPGEPDGPRGHWGPSPCICLDKIVHWTVPIAMKTLKSSDKESLRDGAVGVGGTLGSAYPFYRLFPRNLTSNTLQLHLVGEYMVLKGSINLLLGT